MRYHQASPFVWKVISWTCTEHRRSFWRPGRRPWPSTPVLSLRTWVCPTPALLLSPRCPEKRPHFPGKSSVATELLSYTHTHTQHPGPSPLQTAQSPHCESQCWPPPLPFPCTVCSVSPVTLSLLPPLASAWIPLFTFQASFPSSSWPSPRYSSCLLPILFSRVCRGLAFALFLSYLNPFTNSPNPPQYHGLQHPLFSPRLYQSGPPSQLCVPTHFPLLSLLCWLLYPPLCSAG